MTTPIIPVPPTHPTPPNSSAPVGSSADVQGSPIAVAPPPAPPSAVAAGATALPSDITSILATQVNKKQHSKRVSKARQTSITLRTLHWPTIKEDDLWLLGDGKRGGFAQVPRTISMMMKLINDITKRQTGKSVPAGKTYLVLWLHVYDEGLVRIDSEAEAAFEAGYEGERNTTTFRNHMHLLKDLGFIDFKKGNKGPMQYVLLLNPYKVIKQLHAEKLIPDEHYAALIERAGAIGSGQELED